MSLFFFADDKSPSRSSVTGKVKRKVKRRMSKTHDKNGGGTNWSEPEVELSERESIGFDLRTRFKPSHLLEDANETADSGLYGSVKSAEKKAEYHHPVGIEEDDCESDVSDMELKPVTAVPDDAVMPYSNRSKKTKICEYQ